jgi:hypothetical protein
MGGFRTPAHAQTRDLRWPASENLHHVGRSRPGRLFSKADVTKATAFGSVCPCCVYRRAVVERMGMIGVSETST